VCYGYGLGEVVLDDLPEPKDSARVTCTREVDTEKRAAVQISMGMHVKGAACPKCNLSCPLTAKAGALKRYLCKPPQRSPGVLKGFREFVRNYIRLHFSPLSSTADTSVATWLGKTSYPDWRRRELTVCWDAVGNIWDPERKGDYFKCMSFVKDETYVVYKHARCINSRSDEFKCAVGPIFKLIEDEVYKHPAFIKHVPVPDRPDYIYNMLHTIGAVYVVTDYTAFESLFDGDLMRSCEFELYDYMTADLPEHQQFMGLVDRVIGGRNICSFKCFTTSVDATRMSGEMCTSLGNGFSNLMFMLYACYVKGCTNVKGVVEGDDGLFTMCGVPPTQEDFARLGLRIKLEVHEKLETASFCGMVFDLEDRKIIADPRKILATFGWTNRQYSRLRASRMRRLLRCKSLSLAYQYPGCPIVAELAKAGLRVTVDVSYEAVIQTINKARGMSSWEREAFLSMMSDTRNVPLGVVGQNTRLLVEKLYGITVEQQLQIENYLQGIIQIQVLDHPTINDIMPQVWKDYYSSYSSVVPRLGKYLDYPVSARWPYLKGFQVKGYFPPGCGERCDVLTKDDIG